MALRRLRRTSRVNEDLAAALEYYRARNPAAAVKFLNEFQRMCRLIAQFPEWFPVQSRSVRPELLVVRRAVMRRFDFLIYCAFDDHFVTVLRLVHGAREEL